MNRLPGLAGLVLFALSGIACAATSEPRDARTLFGNQVSVEAPTHCDAAFAEAGLQGTFVLYAPHLGTLRLCNPERAAKRTLPASTFKVFNALVALETAVIADEHEVFRWDGVKRRVESWNADHDLASGMRVSAVWYYQELARRIGDERMREWLQRVGYGNRSTGGGIDRFWLDGELRISPLEQVLFLRGLREGTLPFSGRSERIVRNITRVDGGDGWGMHAKSGWADAPEPDVGWYVGWVERNGEAWYFALNVGLPRATDAPKRLTLTRRLLAAEGLMPE